MYFYYFVRMIKIYLKFISWRGGEQVSKNEQVNLQDLQEPIDTSIPNVPANIEEGLNVFYLF